MLTIRDCYSWLDSYINHHLAGPVSKARCTLRDLRFRPDLYRHHPEERRFEERSLYSIDSCLAFWARHNRHVLATVPAERLLVVRTDELAARGGDIAAFLSIPVDKVNLSRAHSHRARDRLRVLAELDRSFLEDRVSHHCSELMRAWFPEIRCFADSVAAG